MLNHLQGCLLLAPLVVAALPAAAPAQTGQQAPAAQARRSRCLPQPYASPSYSHEVDLSPFLQCGGAATPFSIAYTPDGSRAYATLFGGLVGNGGCVVVRLDPQTLAVEASITSGESPEELAFVTWPDGSMRLGFVTDSSSSTVTVFDEFDQVVATIPIPFDPQATYATAFPYGLAVSPDQSRVHVGTGDGQGFVHAIDVATLSLDASARIDLGADHGAGRMAFAGELLVIPATEYLPNFTGSSAKVCVVDPLQPGVVRSLVLGSNSTGVLFPSLQDVAIDCGGRAWLAGFDLGPRVFVVDPSAAGGPVLVRRVRTETSQSAGKFQGLGLSPDGILWVGDLYTAELSLIDVRRERWIETIDPGQLPVSLVAPNEIAFSPDGSRAAVLWIASENITVFDL